MENQTTITYKYIFYFSSKDIREFIVCLDSDTLYYIPSEIQPRPYWVEDNSRPCEDCTIVPNGSVPCPIERNIAGVVEAFKDMPSYRKVDVYVEAGIRTYVGRGISLQTAVSSLLGLIMATSGCDAFDWLRPMARVHLPFTSIDETVFRSVSTYLLAQYFRMENGLQPDWQLTELQEIYRRIAEINRHICDRIRMFGAEDASVNAVIALDSFAQIIPIAIEEGLTKLMPPFSKYISTQKLGRGSVESAYVIPDDC